MLNEKDITDRIDILNDPTVDIITKNRVAISLSETSDKRVLYCLHSIINNPIYRNIRGTFVHCLRSFPPEDSFNLAIELVLTGNFEVAHEAFEIVDSIENEINQKVVRANYNKVVKFNRENDECEEWRKVLIESLISMFY